MNYNKVYNVEETLEDHARPVHFELPLSARTATKTSTARASQLYIHAHRGRTSCSIDNSAARSVDAMRIGTSGRVQNQLICGLYLDDLFGGLAAQVQSRRARMTDTDEPTKGD